MTVFERIQKALHSEQAFAADSIDGMISLAYHIGYEKAVKDVSDEYSAVLREQLENASKCRYAKMAMKILWTKAGHRNPWDRDEYLYHPDYAQDVSATFGCDETSV